MHLIFGLITLGLILLAAVFLAQLAITFAVGVIIAPFAIIQAIYSKLRSK